MAEIIDQDLDGRIDDKDAYVHAAYERAIGYYRNASRQISSTIKVTGF